MPNLTQTYKIDVCSLGPSKLEGGPHIAWYQTQVCKCVRLQFLLPWPFKSQSRGQAKAWTQVVCGK